MATQHSTAAAAASLPPLQPAAVAVMAHNLACDAHLLIELIDQLVCGECVNTSVQLNAARAVAAGMGAMSDRLAVGHGGEALCREPVQWQLIEKGVLGCPDTSRPASTVAKGA